MRFPFITRAHHEQIVESMKKQLEGCAKLLYPHGVPEEFQLLLGIRIAASAQPKPESERELRQRLLRLRHRDRGAEQLSGLSPAWNGMSGFTLSGGAVR